MKDKSFRHHVNSLKKAYFVRDFRSTAGGEEMEQWIKRVPLDDHEMYRTIEVQLWDDGKHRVTHMIFSDCNRRIGRMTTYPTSFETVEEMHKAIEHEKTRLDNTMYVGKI